MTDTTQTIIDGTLDIIRQELTAAAAAELDALYAIDRAASIVADSLTRSAVMDQAHRRLRRARLAQTQLTAAYCLLMDAIEVKVAPIAEAVAAPVVAATPVAYDVRLPNPPMPRRRTARATPAPVVSSAAAPVVAAAPVAYDVRLPNPPMPRRRTAR